MSNYTLLPEEQVFGNKRLDIFKVYGTKCAVSDFSISLGAYVSNDNHVYGNNYMSGRTGWWYLSSSDGDGHVHAVSEVGDREWAPAGNRSGAVRPVLPYSDIADISLNGVRGREGFLEVEYGEYPQCS